MDDKIHFLFIIRVIDLLALPLVVARINKGEGGGCFDVASSLCMGALMWLSGTFKKFSRPYLKNSIGCSVQVLNCFSDSCM